MVLEEPQHELTGSLTNAALMPFSEISMAIKTSLSS